jgi:hypothetical protein
LEEVNEGVALAAAEQKNDGLIRGANPLQASRSMVACSEYFWS